MESKYQIKAFPLFIFCLAIFIVFFRINSFPIQEWDEARRGINAHLMNLHQDYFNYRYVDTFDNFNTKPPLFTWTVALSLKIFGLTNFALRLPSALCFVVFLGVIYNFLFSRVNKYTLYICLLILIAVEGVLGLHVARSGDTDMMFTLFLTLFLIHFYKLVIEQQEPSLYLGLLFITLAFLTKSFAIALIIPGILSWLGVYRNHIKLIKRTWGKAAVLALLLTCITMFIMIHFQNEGTRDIYAKNLFIDMFFNDAVTRFTDASFEFGYKWDYLPVVLDIKFGPVIYLLYALIIFYLIKNQPVKLWQKLKEKPLMNLMVLSVLSISLLLIASQNKHQWYIAPAIFPLSLITAHMIDKYIVKKLRRFYLVALPILGIIIFKAYKISLVEKEPAVIMPDNYQELIYIDNHTPQHCIFNLYKANTDHLFHFTNAQPEGYIKKKFPLCEGHHYYLKENNK